MATYANKSTKTYLNALAACAGFLETLQEDNPDRMEMEDIKAAHDAIDRALEKAVRGLDAAQVRGVIRFINMHEIVVRPKYSPQSNDDVYAVPKESLDRLLEDVIGDCQFCDKSPQAARRCQRRKDLLECGIVSDRTQGDCPFRRE